MSRICTPHSSPRRTPVIAASHTYSARAALPALRACSITATTAPGGVAGIFFFLTVGGFADSAGLKSTHSQRCAASNAPDRMAWMPWMVLGFIGWQTCGRQPDSLQSWPARDRADRYREAGLLS